MIQRIVLASWLFIASCAAHAHASAQEAPPPSFRASVGLHLAAVITANAGTAMTAGGTVSLFGCAVGASSGCDIDLGIAVGGAVLVGISLALGIAASVVHAETWAARERADTQHTSRASPLVWFDERGGGAGLQLTF